MAYTRRYRTIVPLDPGADLDVLRWLVRESFERKAAGDSLVITDYAEAELEAADIPPKAGKHLALPITDYTWRSFTAVAAAASA